jgi:hypothetical protein
MDTTTASLVAPNSPKKLLLRRSLRCLAAIERFPTAAATDIAVAVSIALNGHSDPHSKEVIMQIEMFIPIVLFICITYAIKVIMDGRVRSKLAQSGASEDLVRTMLAADEQNRKVSSLKWGLVFVLVGLAFGLIDVLDLAADAPATFGIVILAAGLGMLGFHGLANRKL